MAAEQGITIVAVDPAYTSKWGAQHWQQPTSSKTRKTTRHEATSLVIRRRTLGHPARRRTPPPRQHQAGAVVLSGIGTSRPDRKTVGATETAGPGPDRRHDRRDRQEPERADRVLPRPFGTSALTTDSLLISVEERLVLVDGEHRQIRQHVSASAEVVGVGEGLRHRGQPINHRGRPINLGLTDPPARRRASAIGLPWRQAGVGIRRTVGYGPQILQRALGVQGGVDAVPATGRLSLRQVTPAPGYADFSRPTVRDWAGHIP
jgi:hypothetical protein